MQNNVFYIDCVDGNHYLRIVGDDKMAMKLFGKIQDVNVNQERLILTKKLFMRLKSITDMSMLRG